MRFKTVILFLFLFFAPLFISHEAEACNDFFLKKQKIFIEIFSEKEPIFFTQKNIIVPIQKAVVKLNEFSFPLRNFLDPSLNLENQKLEILILDENKKNVEIVLPKKMKQKLLHYLKHGPPSAPFDCNCFAHFINGVQYKYGVFDRTLWNIEAIDSEDVLFTGDTVVLSNHEKQSYVHVAIYLGHGFYLSKFGSGGVLGVATLESMKLAYPSTGISRIKVRSRFF